MILSLIGILSFAMKIVFCARFQGLGAPPKVRGKS
jgi:hypothetical protein